MLVKYIDTTENSDFVVCLAGYRYSDKAVLIPTVQ